MRRILVCLLAAFSLLTPSLFAQAVATLRTGDIFDMRLSGMPPEYAAEYSLQYTVGQDGTVNVPAIGEIKAAGLTATQLERTVQNRLMGEKIFKNPTVIINIATSVRYVSVSGGVRSPQRLQWTADLTLASAIGNCGGVAEFGNGKGIRVIRGGQIGGIFNLKDIQKDPTKDPKLLPGDQVFVPE
jgi:polysaccharide export outer membrane protein